VGVNPADFKFRNGNYAQVFVKQMPLILGMDVAGVVRETGKDVTEFAIGDRVVANLTHLITGGYAERVAAPVSHFARIPDALDFVRAAALPTPGTTGWQLVETDLGVKPGVRLLVTGATGAVGRAACYAGKQLGAHVAAGVRARHRQDAAWCDEVIVLDDPLPQDLPPFDCIADTVGGETANRLLDLLRPGGLLSSVSTFAVGDTRGLDVVSRRFSVLPDPAGLARLCEGVATGELAMPPITTMPLAEVAQAHRLVEAGNCGKIVLLV